MMDHRKWSDFVSTLSSEEINSHLADLFSFTAEYKRILEAELGRRYSNVSGMSYDRGHSNTHDEEDTAEEVITIPSELHNELEGVQLDFHVMNRIQQAVNGLETDQLLEEMKNLDDYLGQMRSPLAMDYQEKIFARETCELRYYDIFGREPMQCTHCQTYLTPEQKFCGKCGRNVS